MFMKLSDEIYDFDSDFIDSEILDVWQEKAEELEDAAIAYLRRIEKMKAQIEALEKQNLDMRQIISDLKLDDEALKIQIETLRNCEH